MAVRFDASGDVLSRSANLPTLTSWTICGWARLTVDRNAISTVCALEGSTGYCGLGTDTNGTTFLGFSGIEQSGTLLSLSTGNNFFWALSQNGSGTDTVTGRARLSSSTALTSASFDGDSAIGTSPALRVGNNSSSEFWNGAIWNVKCWNRVLTAAEILVESFYRRVMFPSSINFHWPLDRHTDLNDYGGNARAATSGGTLATEDGVWGLWGPKKRHTIPAVVVGGSFQAAWARGSNVVLMPGRA